MTVPQEGDGMLELELMIPGPVPVSEATLAVLSAPVIAHYGEAWAGFYNETMSKAAEVFQTESDVLCAVGSGTAGVEAAISSCVSPGETLLVLSNGLFGDRLGMLAGVHGINVLKGAFEPDTAVEPSRAEQLLRGNGRVAAMAMVHCESSSGVLNPIKELASVAHKAGIPVIVDAVSSLGGADLQVDDWGIDVCVTATQKALQAVPGLTLVSVAPATWDRIAQRKRGSWYLNLDTWREYANKWRSEHPHPTTMSTPLIRALRQSIEEILSEGLENRFRRHIANAVYLRDGLASLGLQPYLPEDIASPTIVAMRCGDLLPDAELVQRLACDHGLKIAGGLGPTKGQIVRVGNMGLQATRKAADRVLAAIEQVLQGRKTKDLRKDENG